MSTFAPAGSAQLERRLEAALTPGERVRIGLQLGSIMLACGLLGVAFLQQWFGIIDAARHRPGIAAGEPRQCSA